MTRIGFVGTENSHVQHFIRYLNPQRRHPGMRATALSGGRSPRNLDLAESGGVPVIVEEPSDLVATVDAAIVATRDGAQHLDQARPLLEAGKPVLVDKPLAASVEDAQAILAIARAHSTPLVSCSALRFVPESVELAAAAVNGSGLRHLHLVGPADPDSDYSGLYFYGIHHVEAALEILGNPVVEPGSITVTASRLEDTAVAHTVIAGVHVTFTFITPRHDSQVPFHATAAGARSILARELTLGPDSNAPVLARFVATIEGTARQMTDAELLSPIAVLSAIVTALEQAPS